MRHPLLGLVVGAIVASTLVGAAHAAAAARPAQTPHTDAVAGWVFVAPDERLEGARVRAVSLDGRDLTVESGFTGKWGTFSVWTKKLPARYLLEARGGTVNGLSFTGTLRALVVNRGSSRLVYVDPATTLAARYALNHRRLPYATVLRRVKRELTLRPAMTLGESLRRSADEFDGAAFLTEAARNGGLDKYVRTLAAEVDAHPARAHPFPATRHFDSGPLDAIGVSVGSGIAKAGLGYLLSQVGLSSVSNALGLTSAVPGQLAQLQTTIDGITTTLSGVTSQLNTLTSSLGGLETAVAGSHYSELESSAVKNLRYFTQVTALGSTSDPILVDSAYIAEDASEVSYILAHVLPPAASPDPSAWCAANKDTVPPSPADPHLYTDMCAKIAHDIGTGGPSDGVDHLSWCNTQTNLIATANMAGWSCAVLTYAAQLPHPGTTSGNASESAYLDVAGSDNGDGLLLAYDKMVYARDVQAQPFLTFQNYSLLQDELASVWESRVALLGSYTAIYDAAEPPAAPPPCTVAGVVVQESLAACDVDTATDRTTSTADGIPSLVLPDIPSAWTIDTRTNDVWAMLQDQCSDLPSSYLFPVVPDATCGTGGYSQGYVVPTLGQLQALLGGWSTYHGASGNETPSPNLWLTDSGGFPDVSNLANNAPPAGYGPTGWAGSEFTVLATGSACTANRWDAWIPAGSPDSTLVGLFCPAIRLTDGVTLGECIQSLNNAGFSEFDPVAGQSYGGCDQTFYGNPSCQYNQTIPDCFLGAGAQEPTSYDWTIPPYNNHVDYFHPVLAFGYLWLGLQPPYWVGSS